MTDLSFLREDEATRESDVLQSVSQQAQAVTTPRTDPARLTKRNDVQQMDDPITTDLAKGEIPPPAYGDTYGEIHSEKSGLGTRARVTDDGRVNIRINQANRRLSQIFTPALRQQIQAVQDASPPPPYPYTPPSLGSERGVPPPPLNIVIQVVGSRGDVQPFIALGKVLKSTYGHRIRLATHPTFKNFVEENGLEFFSIGADPSRLMAFMVQNPSLMPGFRTIISGDIGQRRKDVSEYIQGCWRSCYEAGDGMNLEQIDESLAERTSRPFVADCIIANPPSFAHIHCAEKLGIPLHIMFTMPYSPTQAFPHPLANIQSSNADPQLTNYLSYIMIEVLSWQGLGDIINRFRAKCLDLDPVSMVSAPGMLQRLKIPHTYCWSPALIPKPKDWGPHVSTAGFYFLNLASDFTPPTELQEFLNAGPPPAYIGFGSIVLDNPDEMTELIFEAVKKTGQRVLLSKGWGGMGADSLRVPDGVHILGNVPHDWLFKHVSCVVHHGGAGTTAAGIAAGRPTVVVPFFGDQPFWGAMVARAGAGPDPIPHKKLTADNLADAINFCLKLETLERAKELANKIAEERGSDTGAQLLHQHLEVDRLRCILSISRPAAWRITRTKVRLSAFAACTLANANLLDFKDLKLFRPQEYNIDEGPIDPVSGGAAACFRAFSGMVMGVAEIPSETVKAFRLPSRSRQQSQESVPTNAGRSETSLERKGSSIPIPAEPGQMSLNEPDSLDRVRSPSNVSIQSSRSSKIASSSVADTLQGESNPERKNASHVRVSSRDDSRADKNRDMLRQTGAHTSKGMGRFMTTAAKTPTEVTVGLTKGFHNMPKLWGDDTVRPQEKVKGFKSGAVAAGKEFGFGLYDGVTGLVTQPWKGAKKEGIAGFAKGFGKGIGGFASKPAAGMSGLLGYSMQGVQKGIQNWFGSNVQSHIAASRVAQGYEEWLQSTDAEKQDVIDQWRLIQKKLKKDFEPEDMVQASLEAQRMKSSEQRTSPQSSRYAADSVHSTGADLPTFCFGSAISTMDGSQPSVPPIEAANTNAQTSAQDTSLTYRFEDDIVRQGDEEDLSLRQQQQQEALNHGAEQAELRRAIAASELEAQRQSREEREYKNQLETVLGQSVLDQRQIRGDRELGWNTGYDDEFERTRSNHEDILVSMDIGPSSSQRQDPDDPGHLAGTTQSEFEAQSQGPRGEKTREEKMEEEIVLEYIKKQSLLEASHRSKGKDRAPVGENSRIRGHVGISS